MQLLLAVLACTHTKNPGSPQRGQSTVEYILVTLAAATLAIALVSVMGGMGRIASVFNKIIDAVLGMF